MSKFTPEQILQALRHEEGGTAVIDICRKMGFAGTMFDRWRKQYTGQGERAAALEHSLLRNS